MNRTTLPMETSQPEEPPGRPLPSLSSDAAENASAGMTPAQVEDLRCRIVAVLQTCYDPEIPVDIYELGLIYDIDISESGAVGIRMTLTSPACPAAGSLPPEVQAKVRSIQGVTAVKVDIVWDPPWDKGRMSEAARLRLGLFD